MKTMESGRGVRKEICKKKSREVTGDWLAVLPGYD